MGSSRRPPADEPVKEKPSSKPEPIEEAAAEAVPDVGPDVSEEVSVESAPAPASEPQEEAHQIEAEPEVQPESEPEPEPKAETPVVASAPIEGGDDFQRIRAIDADIEQKLKARGITYFEHIAAWSASDVKRIGQELEIPGRIDREQWVEQAQILGEGRRDLLFA